MGDGSDLRPKLRPVEAFPLRDGEEGLFAVRDPSGIAEHTLSVSGPALFILSQFDGTHTIDDVRRALADQFGQSVERQTLLDMVDKLRSGLLLEGPEFETHMATVLQSYRSSAVRPSTYGTELGTHEEATRYLSHMLASDGDAATAGDVEGLIAPHLDYPRGRPCYAAAYGALRNRPVPARVCVLGTNHFGRSMTVTATAKPFETPLGVTEVDTDFLSAVSGACGYDLLENELDHRREHSVELQLICLQHLFGANAFKLVPFLCHDPCGPTGMRPYDGRGVDLRDFANALSSVTAEHDGDTLFVAGADLSHVGAQFGDTCRLDEAFLESVETRDRAALARLEASEPERFVEVLAHDGNATRVCSAGCMFVVAHVLQDATPMLLQYHQAFDEEQQICVSCAAMTFVR